MKLKFHTRKMLLNITPVMLFIIKKLIVLVNYHDEIKSRFLFHSYTPLLFLFPAEPDLSSKGADGRSDGVLRECLSRRDNRDELCEGKSNGGAKRVDGDHSRPAFRHSPRLVEHHCCHLEEAVLTSHLLEKKRFTNAKKRTFFAKTAQWRKK